DVPGTLEVIHRHPDYDVLDWNDSDDEPLSNTAWTQNTLEISGLETNASSPKYIGGKLYLNTVLFMMLQIHYKTDNNV
ncbi:unnamed protein product, partial [Parnassius apollo]